MSTTNTFNKCAIKNQLTQLKNIAKMPRVKDSLTAFLIIIFICHEIQEITCLRIKNFDVPASVTTGSQVFLKCMFELEKDRLVNLKWYFNDKEILRFEPKSKIEETQIFQLPTLNLEKSNVANSADRGSMVHLSSVNKDMSGRYKCEVTIESQFFTINKEKYMEVVDPITTTSTVPPPSFSRPYPRPKSLDLDAFEDEAHSQEVLSNGCSIITLNLFYIMLFMACSALCIERVLF